MDVEKLISEIFLRPPLWDKRDINHHNRFALDRLWNEVAQKMNTKPKTVRMKWKGLRDKFRTTLAKLPLPQSGDAQEVTDYEGQWKYFESLFFLKNQFRPKKSSTNYGDTIDGSIFEDSYEAGDDNEDHKSFSTEQNNVESEESMGVISSSPSRTSSVQHWKPSKQISASLQLEKEQLEFFREKRAKIEEDDEDLSFFKSLLPHVRAFSAIDKIEYRMKIMRITQEFMKQTHSASTSQNIPDNNLATSSNEPLPKYYYDSP